MNVDYLKGLVKGKIVELLFEEMFQELNEFTVIPTGYEYTHPELAQYQDLLQIKDVIENIRSAPDFVLISKDKSKVYLVEVKYRKSLGEYKELFDDAKKIRNRWNHAYLFVATQDGFYYDPCNSIINNQKINKLAWVREDIQQKYLGILKEFIR